MMTPAGKVRVGDNLAQYGIVERVVRHRHWQLAGSVTLFTATVQLLITKTSLIQVVPTTHVSL